MIQLHTSRHFITSTGGGTNLQNTNQETPVFTSTAEGKTTIHAAEQLQVFYVTDTMRCQSTTLKWFHENETRW